MMADTPTRISDAEASDRLHDKRTTRQLGEALAEAGLPASDLARRATNEVRQSIEHRAEDLINWVRARPITSVLIGAGVGSLIGRISGR
jgi:ElaB/YqjD/DUF883 family membrane-anchored ribosome-binding protein